MKARLVNEELRDVLKPISHDEKINAYMEKYGIDEETVSDLDFINKLMVERGHQKLFVTQDGNFKHFNKEEILDGLRMIDELGYELQRLNLHDHYLNYSIFKWQLYEYNNVRAEAYKEADILKLKEAYNLYSTSIYYEPEERFKAYHPNYTIDAPNSNLDTNSITYENLKKLYKARIRK